MEDLIVEFIEVAIHQILFHRDLYPSKFQRLKHLFASVVLKNMYV